MKLLMLLSLVIFSLSAFAEDTDGPGHFCDGNPACTDRMREIAMQYQAGNSDFSKLNLVGYSGGCFHISSMYTPEHEHHSAFIFKREGEALMTNGIFSFFADQDPYQNMTSPELNDWFIANNSRFDKAIENQNQVELQYLGDSSDYHYWFRSNADQSKLSLIAKQASENYIGYIFCDMNRR